MKTDLRLLLFPAMLLLAAAAPVKPTGRLKLVTEPHGAKVMIDGDDAGNTPLVRDVNPGTYHVRLALPGYAEVVKDIVVEAGHEAYEVETLAKIPAPPPPPPPVVIPPPPRPVKIETRYEPKSGLEFVYIPGGTFHYGCEPQDTQCARDETPGHTVTIQSFWLGKTAVTVNAWTKCVTAGGCTAPAPGQRCAKNKDKPDAPCKVPDTGRECNWSVPGKEHHPNNCINWSQAAAFCEWIGGKLPTGEEWEYAAKSGESRIYPWGNDAPDGSRACYSETCSGGTSPADAHAGGMTKFGLFDMAGNVWQWTSNQEIRGGSWGGGVRNLRASNHLNLSPAAWDDTVGVRCRM